MSARSRHASSGDGNSEASRPTLSTCSSLSTSSVPASALSSAQSQYNYHNVLVANGVLIEQTRRRLDQTSLARRKADDMIRAVDSPATRRLAAAAQMVVYEPVDLSRRPGSGDTDPYTDALNSLTPPLCPSPPNPNPAPRSLVLLLFAAHRLCDRVHDSVAQFSPESVYQAAIAALAEEMFSLPDYSMVAAAPEVATSRMLLDELGLSSFIAVKPDFVVGLDKGHICVRPNRHVPEQSSRSVLAAAYPGVNGETMPESLLLDTYMQTRQGLGGLGIFPGNHAQLSLRPWFEFLFFELKGLSGDVSKGRLQNSTAMRISLHVMNHLAKSAQSADPNHFMPPDEEMLTVWGVRTCGADVEVWVMAYDEGKYTTTRVYRLSLDDANELCTLLGFINEVALRATRRHEIIGNWLWCLRDAVKPARAKRRRTTANTARPSPSSRGTRAPGQGQQATGTSSPALGDAGVPNPESNTSLLAPPQTQTLVAKPSRNVSEPSDTDPMSVVHHRVLSWRAVTARDMESLVDPNSSPLPLVRSLWDNREFRSDVAV